MRRRAPPHSTAPLTDLYEDDGQYDAAHNPKSGRLSVLRGLREA